MPADNLFTGVAGKSTPVISFYSIIDEDMAVIKYIILNLYNKNIFNEEFIKNKSYIELLYSIYKRKVHNPLHVIMKDKSYSDFLDNVLEELLNEHEAEILELGVKTEVYNAIIDFQKSREVIPTILYYTDAQKRIIDLEPEFNNIRAMHISEFTNGNTRVTNSDFFFRYIQEADAVKGLDHKTFYFSTTGINLNDDDETFIESNIIDELISNVCHINSFDMYNMKIISPMKGNTENDTRRT